MYKFLLTFSFLIALIVFSGCEAAQQEQENNLTNVSPVLANFETTIDDDIATGYPVGTVELITGDLNITSFTIFSGIFDENGTELEDIKIQDYVLNKERLLAPTQFQIDNDGLISVKAADLIDYVQVKSYSFYVVAENDFGTSQLGTVDINVRKAGRIEVLAASYLNSLSYLSGDDDLLFIFFDRPYDINTVPNDLSNGFTINGTGKIGSNSIVLDDVGSMGPLNYIGLEMQAGGTQNIPFSINSDTIAKTAVGFYDENGLPSGQNSASAVVEKIDLTAWVKSGSDVCLKIETVDEESNASDVNCSLADVIKSEDNVSKALDRNLTQFGDVVIDFGTLLSWQKENDNVSRTFEQAKNYCEYLTLESKSDWRVPTMKELESIVDRSKGGVNFHGKFLGWQDKYWSSDKYAIEDTNPSAWYMNFTDLINGVDLQSEDFYVRCVREIKE